MRLSQARISQKMPASHTTNRKRRTAPRSLAGKAQHNIKHWARRLGRTALTVALVFLVLFLAIWYTTPYFLRDFLNKKGEGLPDYHLHIGWIATAVAPAKPIPISSTPIFSSPAFWHRSLLIDNRSGQSFSSFRTFIPETGSVDVISSRLSMPFWSGYPKVGIIPLRSETKACCIPATLKF